MPVVTYLPAAAPLRAYLGRRTFAGLMFVADSEGKPTQLDTLRKAVHSHLDKLGLSNLYFHGLRHTTATALAEVDALPSR